MFAQYFNKTKPLDQKIIDRSITAVLKRVVPTNPKSVYLFGSVAEGTSHAGSDLDILLVYANAQEISKARDQIYSGLKKPIAEIPVDFIYVTEEDFLRKRDIGGVCYIAHHSGRILFEKS